MMNLTKRTKRTALSVVLLTAVAIVFAGCTSLGDQAGGTSDQPQSGGVSKVAANAPTTNSAEQPGANEVQIVIENFAFVPSEITIAPGTKVTWINKDEAPHTATSTDKKFSSGGLDTDDKFSFVFNDKGEFPYFCALHPHMTATVTVK